jgi:hypothetical protein
MGKNELSANEMPTMAAGARRLAPSRSIQLYNVFSMAPRNPAPWQCGRILTSHGLDNA